MSMFKNGYIDGVIVKDLIMHSDNRGWLIETFRSDEIDNNYLPVMSYISMTLPGIARGPHEHIDQSDFFCFIGPSTFRLYLWDNRKNSSTYMNKMVIIAGENAPKSVIVPPGIVHAYKNIGDKPGFVANYPNRLFMGKNKKEKVDEIRHENNPDTIFILD